jgi:cytoskeleton protein RodZ
VAAAGTAAAPVAVANVAAPPPGTRSKDGELTLKFSSDSWAEVYDASGQRLFYDVGAAASAHTMKGPAPLRVVLGNASGVAVEFNGRPALIPAGVQPDGSTRFIINAHGRTVPAGPASDGD